MKMTLWLSLSFFFVLFMLNVSIQHAEPTKLRLKKGKTQTPGEKKGHLFVPVPFNLEGTRTAEHRCLMPVPIGNDENVLYLHIHEENPCNNGGLMHMERECVFRCLCPPPYGGSLCQDRLYCYCNPCKNGGSCEDLENGFQCHCKDGFTGYSCEERNYCKPNPCSHHATCVEGTGGFKCICKEGYKGDECKDFDPCFPNPCRNNGVCQDIKGVATCECKPPYKGIFCTDILLCYHNPCHHNGVCVENPTRPCICKRGFIGTYCEDHVCNPNPCVNGGTCKVSKSHGYQRWIFKCICPPGFTGTLCHIPHPCSINICLNGGTCIDAHANELDYESSAASISPVDMDFFCQCVVGFTGKKCETKVCDLCDKNADCINNHCVCKANFTGNGFYCREIDDPCKPNPCKNNGVCVLGPDNSYTCNCATGYCGAQCESICNPCASNPCKNGGTCKVVGGNYVCVCPPNFTGPQCGTSLPNPCDSKPCLNGGTCEPIPDKNDYRCLCKGKFTGKNCEVCDCPKAKPLDKSVALDQKCDAEGGCYCPPYKGEDTIYVPGRGCIPKGTGPCQSNPCKNGGTCEAVGTLANIGYVCKCRNKYYGKNCECTECTCNSPCLNNGICEDIDTHIYKCTCPAGFTGAKCEAILPTAGPRPCQSNPCVNGGTCVDRHIGYDCLCKAQFTGPHCEVDKCKDCDINADCVYGTCRCRKGYIGTGYVCEKEDNECENVVCPIHHRCIQGMCVCLSSYVC